MKKVFSLILIFALVLTAMIACKKPCDPHTDSDKNYVCDVCGEILPNNSLILSDAIINRVKNAKSVKIELETSTINLKKYWDEDDQGNTSYVDDYYEEIEKVEMTVSRAEKGVICASFTVSGKHRKDQEDDFKNDDVSTIYLVDNIIYTYDKDLDAYTSRKLTIDLDQLVATVDALTDGVSLTEDEKNELLTGLGDYVLTTFNIIENKGSASIDLKDDINSLFSYLANLDLEKDTLGKVLGDALALIDEDLTVEEFMNELFRVLDLTATEALAELDEWLTEEHETTLQGIYDQTVNNPAIAQLIKNAIKLDLPEDTENADKQIEDEFLKIKNFKIADALAEFDDATLYEIISFYVVGIPAEKIEDLEAVKDMLSATLDTTIEDNDMFSTIFSYLKELGSENTINALNAKLELQFEGIFKLNEIRGEFNIDILSTQPSELVKGENDTNSYKSGISVRVYDISEDAIEITIPTDKDIYLFANQYFYDGNDELYIYLDDEGVNVNLTLSTNSGNVSVFATGLSSELLKSTTITIPGEKLNFSADHFIKFDKSTPLTITVDTDEDDFNIESIPEYIFPVTAADALKQIGIGEGVDNSDTYDLTGEFYIGYIDQDDNQVSLYLNDDFYLSTLNCTYTFDENGNMICTISSITSDQYHLLRSPVTGNAFHGSASDSLDLYLGGYTTFTIYIDGNVVRADIVPDVVDEYKANPS